MGTPPPVGLMSAPEPPIPKTTLPSVQHVLAPKSAKASSKEVKELCSKLGITRDKLPWVKLLDPSVRHLDVKEGDVVKFLRESPITGKEEVYYRVVVP